MINKTIVLGSLVLVMFSCAPGKSKNGEEGSMIKQQQYHVEGLRLYRIHCENCHQADGKGVGKLIPPLAGSDYLRQYKNKAICGIRHGLKGELVVNGVTFNQAMPGLPLEDLDIAELMTYITNTWGNEASMTSIEEVREAFSICK